MDISLQGTVRPAAACKQCWEVPEAVPDEYNVDKYNDLLLATISLIISIGICKYSLCGSVGQSLVLVEAMSEWAMCIHSHTGEPSDIHSYRVADTDLASYPYLCYDCTSPAPPASVYMVLIKWSCWLYLHCVERIMTTYAHCLKPVLIHACIVWFSDE